MCRSQGLDRREREKRGVGADDEVGEQIDDQRRANEFRILVVMYIGRLKVEPALAMSALEDASRTSSDKEFLNAVSETLGFIRTEQSATRKKGLQRPPE